MAGQKWINELFYESRLQTSATTSSHHNEQRDARRRGGEGLLNVPSTLPLATLKKMRAFLWFLWFLGLLSVLAAFPPPRDFFKRGPGRVDSRIRSPGCAPSEVGAAQCQTHSALAPRAPHGATAQRRALSVQRQPTISTARVEEKYMERVVCLHTQNICIYIYMCTYT